MLSTILTQRFAAGEWIFHQGDRTDYFYVVVSGTVQIVNEREEKVIQIKKADSIFGELGFITGKPRALGARTGAGVAQVLKIDYDTCEIAPNPDSSATDPHAAASDRFKVGHPILGIRSWIRSNLGLGWPSDPGKLARRTVPTPYRHA